MLLFIRDMLTGATLSFAEGFQRLTNTSYATYLAAQPSFVERAVNYIQNTLRIPRRWQRYMIVFGALILIALLFLTVQLPETRREESAP